MPVNLDGLAKAAEALSAPLTKLIEVAASGLGAIAGPPLLILQAHCEGKAALIRSGYEQKLRRLEASHAAELRMLPSAAPLQLPSGDLGPGEIEVLFEEDDRAEVRRAANTFAFQTLRRRANAMAIMGEAADNIGDDVSDEPVDADWAARFFDSAQDVSAADLQRLWGRLLAREVEKPGAVPLRTVELLRTMTQHEADVMRKLKACLTQQPLAYIVADTPVLAPDDLRLLRDMGVLPELWQMLDWGQDVNALTGVPTDWHLTLTFFGGARLAIRAPGTQPDLLAYPVGSAAAALLEVIPETTDPGYIRRLCEFLTDESRGRRNQVELTALSAPQA